MLNIIDGIDFVESPVQKYWSFPAGTDNPKALARNMIFSGEYIGSRKYDGAFYKFIKDEDGNMRLQGRSKGVGGEYLNKIGHVPQLHPFFDSLPNGTVLLGELYFPNNEGSRHTTTIMGCKEDKAITRQEKGDKLFYYVFDVLAFNGHSLLNKTIIERVTTLYYIRDNFNSVYINFAEYFTGKELWDKLQEILSNGGEGVVITKLGTTYQPGKRPARQTLKIKKEVQQNIDCFFTGRFTNPAKEYTGKELQNWKYYQNVKTGELVKGLFYKEYITDGSLIPVTKSYFMGMAGSLEIAVLKDEKVYPIGLLSGLTEEIKSNPIAYKNKCIEVNAMQIEPDTGALRHAKLVQFRPDLNIEDCTWSKIFE